MKDKQIFVQTKEGTTALEIREGAALPLKEPVKIVVIGQIDAITKYIKQRMPFKDIRIDIALIVVNRDKMQIFFQQNPGDFYGTEITGKLELSKEFMEWGINTKETYSPHELADFIKMHRSHFEKKEEANKLVSILRNFEAKVNKEIQDKDDKKGNTDLIRRQTVQSNLPEGFNLKIPIFKGTDKQKVNIEIDIDARTLECYLISPEAQEVIDETRDQLIDAEIDQLKEFCVIEQ